MNCSNCNRPLDPAWLFCEFCGHEVPARQDERNSVKSPAEALTGDTAGGPGDLGLAVPSATEPATMPGPAWPGQAQPAAWPASAPDPVITLPPPAPQLLPGSPVRLGQDERILRQYAAVQLRSRQKGEGTLYVTDSRIVFYARAKGRGTQRPSSLIQQTKLSEISGVTAYSSRRISLILIVGAIFCALAAVSSLLTIPPFALLWLGLLVVCVILLARGGANRGSTGVIISSRTAGESPIHFGTFGTRRGAIGQLTHLFGGPLLSIFGVYTVFDVTEGHPGRDTEQIISELGALILDLQTRGDLAFSYYGVDAGQRQHEPGAAR